MVSLNVKQAGDLGLEGQATPHAADILQPHEAVFLRSRMPDSLAFDPDPSLRWLFWLAHPDDEVAIAAWIHDRVAAGCAVGMAWSHRTPVRETEARAVADVLGVPEAQRWFLDAPDGHAVDHLTSLAAEFARVGEAFRPDRVVVPAFEQGHLDHDAANFLANRTWPGRVREFPMYHCYTRRYQTLNAYIGNGPGERREHSPDERRLKIAVARSYPSQTLWRNVVWYERWWRLRGRPVGLAHRELLRVQTHVDFRRPNLDEPHRSPVEASAPWRRWIAALDAFDLENE